jgi:hypothetical protein
MQSFRNNARPSGTAYASHARVPSDYMSSRAAFAAKLQREDLLWTDEQPGEPRLPRQQQQARYTLSFIFEMPKMAQAMNDRGLALPLPLPQPEADSSKRVKWSMRAALVHNEGYIVSSQCTVILGRERQ